MISICCNSCIKFLKKLEKNQKERQKLILLQININDQTNYLSEKADQKNFEKDNPTSILNVLNTRNKKVYPACISKYNTQREKQVIVLMVPNKEG